MRKEATVSKQAKAPWSYIEFAGMQILLDATGIPVDLDIIENRERIVACVNACEGLDNEQVKNLAKKVNTLVMDHADALAQRDELLSALEDIKFFVDDDFPPNVELGQRSDEYTAAWEKMNEVIAKVKGGQS